MFDKLTMQTKDLAQENIKKLADLFPECVTESKDGDKTVYSIDFDVLKKLLGDSVVEGYKERYQFTWPDKSKTMDFLLTPSTMTLRPCRAESVDFDHTKNLYIEGDNLEVLKLIRETYLGKIKMIYIDPPYNTGNDFVYRDNFKLSDQEYSKVDGNYSDAGDCLVENPPSNGRFHTDWLNMIYSRLMIAKEIIAENGVIFISIDNHEVANLKKICDEIFGEINFVDIINWKGRGGRQDSKYFACIHEYILCYAKNIDKFNAGSDIQKEVYPKYDSTLDKYYKTQLLRKWGSNSRQEDRPNLYYPIKDPDGNDFYPMISETEKGRWRWGKETMSQAISDNKVEFVKQKNNTWIAYEKIYQPDDENQSTKKFTTWVEDIGTGTKEIKKLFEKNVFDYSKSTDLIIHFMKMAGVCDSDIVCDFFSGSSTTAHAILKYNQEFGTSLQYVLIQIPALCSVDSIAYKSGFKNICEIGKERIRRAGKEIHNKLDGNAMDVGFRVLKLDSSNMNSVYYNPNEIRQSIVEYSVDNIKSDRTNEDLLFQAMIEFGIDLSSPISKSELCGKEVFDVDYGYLIACFDENISDEVITEIAKKKPVKFVIRDKSLASDSVAINFEQIFKTYSPNTHTKVL